LELNAKYAKSKEYREYVQKYNSMYRLVNLDALQKKDQEYKKNNIDACKSRDRLRYNMNTNSINEKRRTRLRCDPKYRKQVNAYQREWRARHKIADQLSIRT
jgi:hypothetical protein